MARYLQVRHLRTGEVAKRIDVTGKSERQIERIEMGILINADLDNWCVEEVSE